VYVAFYFIQFSDGGHAESRIIHEGTREDCLLAIDLFPGVTYSGERPGATAAVAVCTKERFDSVCVKPS
jgi:hypothetical protein